MWQQVSTMGKRYDTMSLCATHKTVTAISSSFHLSLRFVIWRLQTQHKHMHQHTHIEWDQRVVRANRLAQGMCMFTVASYLSSVNATHDNSLRGLKSQSGSQDVEIFWMSAFISSVFFSLLYFWANSAQHKHLQEKQTWPETRVHLFAAGWVNIFDSWT